MGRNTNRSCLSIGCHVPCRPRPTIEASLQCSWPRPVSSGSHMLHLPLCARHPPPRVKLSNRSCSYTISNTLDRARAAAPRTMRHALAPATGAPALASTHLSLAGVKTTPPSRPGARLPARPDS
eukprot:scaffold3451_cov116-Isochrysis_galbana.AAC.8